MSTLAVVEQILRETRVPMTVREIVEYAGESLPTKSKTPDTVVARDLSMDIKKRGEESRFFRASPGRYTLRDGNQGATAERNDANEAVDRRVEAETTPVLSSAMRHERAAPLGARAAVRPAAVKQQQQ